MPGLKVVYMGTPDFAVPALKVLHESPHEVICVYTQPPRPKGRGQKVQPSPVQLYAEAQNIPVRHPVSFKDAQDITDLNALEADIAVVAAYGLILPQAILDAPVYGCLNIHASLLPRWRGASPIQHAIWKGDTETGVTIMQMERGLDTGPMITKRTVSISGETTAQSLHDDLSILGAEMITHVLDDIAARKARPEAEMQDNAKTCYAPLLTKDHGRIDWNQTAIEIDRQVRALNPWPGVWTINGEKRLKILAAKVMDTKTGHKPATALQNGIIACGSGTSLKLITVQPENAKPMEIEAAINGGYLKTGDVLA